MFTNNKHIGEDFGAEIKTALKNAQHVQIASGYFSYRLLQDLTPQLLKIARAGSFKLLVGMIFHEKVTKRQKECLDQLNKQLRSVNSDSGIYITIERYHGKIFRIVDHENNEKIYVGSSNFSLTGFKNYNEFNLQIFDEGAKTNVRDFLDYLFFEMDKKKKIAFPLEDVDLKLKDGSDETRSAETTLRDFKINERDFPGYGKYQSMTVIHRPEVQPASSLNLYFDKGRKDRKSGRYAPRPWYEVEVTSQKHEQDNPIYPKGEWTAFVKEKINGETSYYRIPMVTSSGQKDSPKAIQSKNGRHILGELIKGKMERTGALSKHEQITQDTLDLYGRDYIELTKISDGIYFLEV